MCKGRRRRKTEAHAQSTGEKKTNKQLSFVRSFVRSFALPFRMPPYLRPRDLHLADVCHAKPLDLLPKRIPLRDGLRQTLLRLDRSPHCVIALHVRLPPVPLCQRFRSLRRVCFPRTSKEARMWLARSVRTIRSRLHGIWTTSSSGLGRGRKIHPARYRGKANFDTRFFYYLPANR